MTPWIAADDWKPACRLANRFFPKIICKVEDDPLWDGVTLRTSTPMNLLHEVAHYQIASPQRRHKEGYGLGLEPEGLYERYTPLLVSDFRAAYEESMASVLGLLWADELGYDWADEASSHGWGNYCERFKSRKEFLTASDVSGYALKLRRLELLDDVDAPLPSLARPWRASRRGLRLRTK